MPLKDEANRVENVNLEDILNLREWTDIKSRETIFGITKVCLYYSEKKKYEK